MYFIFKYIYVILIDSPDLLFTTKLRAQCHVTDKLLVGCTKGKLALRSSVMF